MQDLLETAQVRHMVEIAVKDADFGNAHAPRLLKFSMPCSSELNNQSRQWAFSTLRDCFNQGTYRAFLR